MTIENLSNNLDKVIENYELQAGKSCQYCGDDYTGNALHESHKAVAKALSSFKSEILTYLSQI